MRIQYLTFTGADDETPIQELVEISAEFPYVEWAILFGSKQGLGRYPSLEWVETLPSLQLSAHFCGSYVDRYTNGDDPRVHELFKPFKRYQFNMTGARLKKAIEAKAWTLPLPHPVIYGGNYTGINTEALDDSVACLFDTSGGRGILTKEWPKPIPGVFCGYAGGLGLTILWTS